MAKLTHPKSCCFQQKLHEFCLGPSSLALEGIWKMGCVWCETEEYISAVQNEIIDLVYLCSASTSTCLFPVVFPSGNIIHLWYILCGHRVHTASHRLLTTEVASVNCFQGK